MYEEQGIERRKPTIFEEVTPDGPEVIREVTTVKGAVTAVHNAVNDLIQKIQPVMRDEPEDDQKLAEIPTYPRVSTPVSRELQEVWRELSTIETKLRRVYNKVEL